MLQQTERLKQNAAPAFYPNGQESASLQTKLRRVREPQYLTLKRDKSNEGDAQQTWGSTLKLLILNVLK